MEKLSREELFELVWTTPISKLASRFGVSDVALAKTCAKFDIPRPGRGYWQQLAAGIEVEKPPLPASPRAEPVVLSRGPSLPNDSNGGPPLVRVRAKLKEPHETVKWLEHSLASAKPDRYGRLVVAGAYGRTFLVSPSSVQRALCILDALAKTLAERDHEVDVARRGERLSAPVFLVRSDGFQFALEVEEKLAQKPHVPTARERELKAKGYDFVKYDYFPDGELKIKVAYTHYAYHGQKSWSDTRTRRLDDSLGRMVVAIEEAVRVARIQREEQVRRAQEQEAEEARRLRPERLQWYGEWLTRDLERMIDDRERALRIRGFVEEYERLLPPEARTATSARWSGAVLDLADRFDPMGRISEVAKEMEPSNETLARLIEEEESEEP